jgi:hypothetical protein
MAAGDFSLSQLFNLQGLLADMFSPDGPAGYELQYPAKTAEIMLQRQTARPVPTLFDGQTCIGVNTHWLKSGDETIDYTGDGTSTGLNCDLATGWQPEADRQIYTKNVVTHDTFQVSDNDCDNLQDYEQIRAFALAKTIGKLRNDLNTRFINFLDTQKQDNQDGEVTDSSGDVTTPSGDVILNADGKTIEIPEADLQDPDTMATIDAIIQNNYMENYFLVAGRYAFRNAHYNAQWKMMNDNQRSIFPQIDDHDITFDIRKLDSTLGGKNLFAVDPNAYIFWNMTWSPDMNMRQIDEDKFEFYVEDPVLMVMGPGGAMQPLRYEVVMQHTCAGRDSNTRHYFTDKFEVKLLGGLYGAPDGANGETGVLKFSGVNAG